MPQPEAGPFLEFLKSVEKSKMKLPGVNNKDHKQVKKGPHLTLQRDRNPDDTLGETWSIIKLPYSISLQQDHVQPGLKPVPPTKHITKVIPQGKDDEDSSIIPEDVPSLEFLKSVQKSNVNVHAVDNKDNEVTKGRILILQKDHVKPVHKPAVPPTKHTNKLNSQSQDEDSSNVSEDGPSLEFLKSVEKSVKRIQPTVPPVFAKNEVNVAKKIVIRCPKKAFKNILFSLRMFPSQERFSSMSLPMARIFYVLNLQPHPPLKPRLLLCPQLVVKPLLVVKNRIPS